MKPGSFLPCLLLGFLLLTGCPSTVAPGRQAPLAPDLHALRLDIDLIQQQLQPVAIMQIQPQQDSLHNAPFLYSLLRRVEPETTFVEVQRKIPAEVDTLSYTIEQKFFPQDGSIEVSFRLLPFDSLRNAGDTSQVASFLLFTQPEPIAPLDTLRNNTLSWGVNRIQNGFSTYSAVLLADSQLAASAYNAQQILFSDRYQQSWELDPALYFSLKRKRINWLMVVRVTTASFSVPGGSIRVRSLYVQ